MRIYKIAAAVLVAVVTAVTLFVENNHTEATSEPGRAPLICANTGFVPPELPWPVRHQAMWEPSPDCGTPHRGQVLPPPVPDWDSPMPAPLTQRR